MYSVLPLAFFPVLAPFYFDFPSFDLGPRYVECGETSPEVSYARSLRPETLEKLYTALVEYAASPEYRDGGSLYRVDWKHSPNQFQDIHYLNVIFERPRVRFLLAGCFDAFVTIEAHGVIDDRPPQLVLSWGEPPNSGSEVLWKN